MLKEVPSTGLSSEQLNTFHADGFLNLGALFDRQQIQDIRHYFKQALADPHPKMQIDLEDNGAVRSVMGWHHASENLRQFALDERLLSIVQSILGLEPKIHQTKFNPKAPREMGRKWDPHRGFTFWHFLDEVPHPEKMLSVFIALTDQTEENGAVHTWKGSHLIALGQLREETDFSGRTGIEGDTAAKLSLQIKEEYLRKYKNELEEVSLLGQAGTVWLVHSLNLHVSAPNMSCGTRELVANVFRSADNQPKQPRVSYLCEP